MFELRLNIRVQVNWITNVKTCCSLGMKPLVGEMDLRYYVNLRSMVYFFRNRNYFNESAARRVALCILTKN